MTASLLASSTGTSKAESREWRKQKKKEWMDGCLQASGLSPGRGQSWTPGSKNGCPCWSSRPIEVRSPAYSESILHSARLSMTNSCNLGCRGAFHSSRSSVQIPPSFICVVTLVLANYGKQPQGSHVVEARRGEIRERPGRKARTNPRGPQLSCRSPPIIVYL